MTVFKCKMCGGNLEVNESMSVGTCEYCGSTMTLPKLDDDKRVILYDRANHFRRNNEFDKAMSIYETILNEDKTDAEAYWSLVLCKYGIEYVEDPKTHKYIPTCNRTQFTSVFADENYKQAISNSEGNAKSLYQAEAKAIDEIQKGILEISSKEEPFDIFICYKDRDSNGKRTPDSVLAQDLYYSLTNAGFKVFLSRITLEDKLGTAYEPYIFAALNSSRVMVVIGTKPEYFGAVWVKNEWSRYLALIKNGTNKILIPAYKDMDPYDLPDEFSYLQAQDMSKLGFMQDLIRGIKKIIDADEPKVSTDSTMIIQGNTKSVEGIATLEKLLQNAETFHKLGETGKATEILNKITEDYPEDYRAWWRSAQLDMNTPYDSSKNRYGELEEQFYNKLITCIVPVIKFGIIVPGSSPSPSDVILRLINKPLNCARKAIILAPIEIQQEIKESVKSYINSFRPYFQLVNQRLNEYTKLLDEFSHICKRAISKAEEEANKNLDKRITARSRQQNKVYLFLLIGVIWCSFLFYKNIMVLKNIDYSIGAFFGWNFLCGISILIVAGLTSANWVKGYKEDEIKNIYESCLKENLKNISWLEKECEIAGVKPLYKFDLNNYNDSDQNINLENAKKQNDENVIKLQNIIDIIDKNFEDTNIHGYETSIYQGSNIYS